MVDLCKTARPPLVPFGLGQCKKPYPFGAMSRERKSDVADADADADADDDDDDDYYYYSRIGGTNLLYAVSPTDLGQVYRLRQLL